jgi:thiamine biosynthesis lipoprotein ApbE
MAIKKVIKNGVIKYVRVKEEEDNQKVPKMGTLVEEDQKDKKEIARLTALVETLTKELEKQSKPKEEAPSSDVMAVAAASTYSCYG